MGSSIFLSVALLGERVRLRGSLLPGGKKYLLLRHNRARTYRLSWLMRVRSFVALVLLRNNRVRTYRLSWLMRVRSFAALVWV